MSKDQSSAPKPALNTSPKTLKTAKAPPNSAPVAPKVAGTVGITRHFVKPNVSKTLQEYINILRELDKDKPQTSEYGSILILGLMEEIGEISRAYLAEHGRKPTNKAAQRDETYKQELGDLIISILRLAIHKNINLDHRIQYTLKKIQKRKTQPKE